jgi:hypothetical protein
MSANKFNGDSNEKVLADFSSIPFSSTNHTKPNHFRLGFFMPATPVLARFCALAS